MKNKDLEYFRKMLTRWQEDLYKQSDVTFTDLQECRLLKQLTLWIEHLLKQLGTSRYE